MHKLKVRMHEDKMLTWAIGVLELGHLRCDEFGGVLLPAAVPVPLLTLLHLFIIILNIRIKHQML